VGRCSDREEEAAVADEWDEDAEGVLTLPSGRQVRGRSLRSGVPPGEVPQFALLLSWRRPAEQPWPSRWVRWADFWLPSSPEDARDALRDAWRKAADRRVEVACGGGVGRTGTALACLAVLDGVAAEEAVAFVRREYLPRAVETPWQRRFVAGLDPEAGWRPMKD
jgi:hypothetical protein